MRVVVFCHSLISDLNISRGSIARYSFLPPTRIFEAAGAGACLITDDWAGIEQFLEPDREVLVAPSGEAVVGRLAGLTTARVCDRSGGLSLCPTGATLRAARRAVRGGGGGPSAARQAAPAAGWVPSVMNSSSEL